MPKDKEETPPATETEETIEYTGGDVPPELRGEDTPAQETKPAEAEVEAAPKEEELTVTVEEEAPAEEAAGAPAEEKKEPTIAEQIASVREVYDERFEKQTAELNAQLQRERAQMEQQYAPLLKATKKQEEDHAFDEAVQSFHKALGPEFEATYGVSPQAAEAIAKATMQHLLPADPFMRDTRTANENAIYRDTWSKFDTSVANQVEVALKTTEVSQESRQKGMEVYEQLRQSNPQMGLTKAAQKVADAIVEAERSNGKPVTVATESAPPPIAKASVTGAAPPHKQALTEDEAILYEQAKILRDEDKRLGFDQRPQS